MENVEPSTHRACATKIDELLKKLCTKRHPASSRTPLLPCLESDRAHKFMNSLHLLSLDNLQIASSKCPHRLPGPVEYSLVRF